MVCVCRITSQSIRLPSTWRPGHEAVPLQGLRRPATCRQRNSVGFAQTPPESAAGWPPAPTPTGTAFCIARPRKRRRRAASATVNDRAAAKADYSPSEWPATKAASRARSTPASVSSARNAASDTAMSAGCAFSVSVSVSAGPFQIVSLSFSPSARRHPRTPAAPAQRPRPSPCPYRPPDCPGREIRKPSPSIAPGRTATLLATDHQLNQGLRPY